MYFTSRIFILFSIVHLFCYYAFPKRYQKVVLLFGNFVFYLWLDYRYGFFLFTTIFSVYFSGVKIRRIRMDREKLISLTDDKEEKRCIRSQSKICKKKYLYICLILNFGILGLLKYSSFLVSNINHLLYWGNLNFSFVAFEYLIPLGLSFYTFQAISYILDVYWEKEEAETSFLNLLLYLSFFPQMIQGPITRYSVAKKSMFCEHQFSFEVFYQGLVRVLYGFFKKLVIADRLMPIVVQMTGSPEDFDGIYFLFAMFFYAIALYSDFSGGIDITLGIGRLYGIHLSENFNRPFFSRSIVEYWRRWHMTMGAWFRDYLFYPLSISPWMLKVSTYSRKKLGNELGKKVPFYFSTLSIWFCTGFWHGASWNYIAWGLSNGIVILLSKELEPFYNRFHEKFPVLRENPIYIGFSVCRTFVLMCFIRAFDCYGSVSETLAMYRSVFFSFGFLEFVENGFSQVDIATIQWVSVIFGVLILIFLSMLVKNTDEFFDKLSSMSWYVKAAVVYFLIFTILIFGAYGLGYDASQFIYHQF